jgi:hypothetical protein
VRERPPDKDFQNLEERTQKAQIRNKKIENTHLQYEQQ